MRQLILTAIAVVALSATGSGVTLAAGVDRRTMPVAQGGHISSAAVAPAHHSAAIAARRVQHPARINPATHFWHRPFFPYYYHRGFLGSPWYSGPFWYGDPWAYEYALPYAAEPSTGGLRLEVKPKTAQTFVDGYYAGIVDDFDGHFQHLTLTPGEHRIELRAPGYKTRDVDVYIQAGETTDWRGALVPANG